MPKYAILLVDDEPTITKIIGSYLERYGHEITTADNGEKAIEWLNRSSFDLVITDLIMTPVSGIEVLKASKRIHPETMVILLTGFGNMDSVIEALRLDADDYLLKPFDLEEMYFRVSRCLEKLKLRRKIKVYERILPVCCICKRIRDDRGRAPGTGEWMSMEKYMYREAKVDITSTYCPECKKKAMDELNREFPK
ncbi:MAG: response regulator [Deltaproteobacteria bacterium]|nr:response regulator [Deltaproteobacteria bacterium]